MLKVKVGIIGAGKGGGAVYRALQDMEYVKIVGVADINPDTSAMYQARRDGVWTTTDLEKFFNSLELDVIIEATGSPEVQEAIHQKKKIGTAVMEAQAANLFITVIEEKLKLLESKKLKGELSAILNSVQEAIEVADSTGKIKYVNPAFTKVTGIPEALRINKNIFEVSPKSALAKALVTQKSVAGHRTKVGGSGVEVISNAAPIVVEGEMEGAVVVFQPMTDIIKLMDELNKSTTIIQNLYARIGQITGSKYTFDDLIGVSKNFRATLEIAKKAARSDSTVLIVGESGTGKELYAHAIHHGSYRLDKPFIKVNCAAIPESLLESEFFGHEKGAFTGAVRTKLGKVELANGGTLFLDEIGDMNLFLQAKLLRVLQEMEFERVGGTQTIKVDVRIIAATNRYLKSLVRKGAFREDLYYRLNVVELKVPPLRERKEDIPQLINHQLIRLNRKLGKNVQGICPEAVQLLVNYEWPGNVRELENVIERAMVIADDDKLTHKHLAQYIGQFETVGPNRYIDIMSLDKMEQMLLKAALSRYGDTLEGKKKAAQALNISLATLYNKLKKYKTNFNN
ncbi:MAG: sigma-54 interaction domain-containing protein [Bacillota bacterium]